MVNKSIFPGLKIMFGGRNTSVGSVVKRIEKNIALLSPSERLCYLLELDNELYHLLGQASVRYGNGIHTKHKHIKYHDFFINHLKAGDIVLDLGCGNGACAYDVVSSVPGCTVIGIDKNVASINSAQHTYKHENLSFLIGDITKKLPDNKISVVILSNVLEHISNRVEFLTNIRTKIHPNRILIRVPVYERDWKVPLKEELGIDYRLDSTHEIEYRKGEFEQEISLAGLSIEEVEYGWGEMWCVVSVSELSDD